MIEVRRATSRFVTEEPGRSTFHSFSFGPHYDPGNVALGALVCHNDDRLLPGSGYAEHPHANLEIVTWVLAGQLTHGDPHGRRSTIGAGEVQVLSAGSGVRHSETVDPGAGPTRFVQTWVRPDRPDTVPTYRRESVSAFQGWTQVAGAETLPLGTAGAALSVARLAAGDRLLVPDLALGHLFLATGRAAVGVDLLEDGDALRLRHADPVLLTCVADAELVLWSLPGS